MGCQPFILFVSWYRSTDTVSKRNHQALHLPEFVNWQVITGLGPGAKPELLESM